MFTLRMTTDKDNFMAWVLVAFVFTEVVSLTVVTSATAVDPVVLAAATVMARWPGGVHGRCHPGCVGCLWSRQWPWH